MWKIIRNYCSITVKIIAGKDEEEKIIVYIFILWRNRS